MRGSRAFGAPHFSHSQSWNRWILRQSWFRRIISHLIRDTRACLHSCMIKQQFSFQKTFFFMDHYARVLLRMCFEYLLILLLSIIYISLVRFFARWLEVSYHELCYFYMQKNNCLSWILCAEWYRRILIDLPHQK